MFRKTMLAGFAAMMMGTGLFGAATASAHDGHDRDRDRRGGVGIGIGIGVGFGDRDRGRDWDRGRGSDRWDDRRLPPPPVVRETFKVFYTYRHGWHTHTALYGEFRTRWEAERAERFLESRGYRAFTRAERC